MSGTLQRARTSNCCRFRTAARMERDCRMIKKKPGLPAGCAHNRSNAEETCWFGRDPGVAARLYPSHHLYDQRSLSKGEKQCPCFFAI